jgi:hypothetical protein
VSAENILLSNLAANGRADLLVDGDLGESDRRFVSRSGMMTFAVVASAVGITLSIRSQYRTIAPLQAVEAGGTTGVFPDMQQKGIVLPVYAGEKLIFEVRETAAAATTDIMLTIDTP